MGGVDAPDEHGELLRRFGHWHAPIRALIEQTPLSAIVRTDIHDRPPVQRWARGRVVLLGDAAHPMTPDMGQGGGQAVEDAVVLAQCLASEPELSAALSRYQSLRIPRANGFVSQSRRIGQVGQWENPLACWVRDRLFQLVPQRRIRANLRRVLAFEAGQPKPPGGLRSRV